MSWSTCGTRPEACTRPATRRSRTGSPRALQVLTGHADHAADTIAAQATTTPGQCADADKAVRYLLDITGARWGLPGAEALLRLRALIDNGDFDAYWSFHAARHHQRLDQTHRASAQLTA